MTHRKSNTVTAAFWMVGAIASFTTMAVTGREASVAHDTFEIMFYRSVVGFLIVSAVLTITGTWRQVNTELFGIHVLRNAAHFTGQNLWFFAITAIPLAQVIALEFTTPLWVIVLAPLILKERLTSARAIAAFVGFIGVLIVARPNPSTINLGLVTAAAAAIFFAITLTVTKRLTLTQKTANILFWLTAMQILMGAVMAGYDGDFALPTVQSLPLLLIIGLAGVSAHYCLTSALALAPATIVIPMDFARLPTVAILGMLIYSEPLDIWVLVGAVVIFAANYYNILAEGRANPAAATPGLHRDLS
ncbi:DMT family transporter [Aliisedimentitalea scapharcae]|uniref:DMT family transporter n=1 Tax=Aliisedimentitalea scapharcae TaxID=1524259 RepID=A0ABZ2XY39_9RHOB